MICNQHGFNVNIQSRSLNDVENFGMSVVIRCENDVDNDRLFMIEMQVS